MSALALYDFAFLSSLMAELAHHMVPLENRTALQARTGGEILSEFRKCVKKAKATKPDAGPIGRAAADMFQALDTRRSDIMHAYPIADRARQQILHRRLGHEKIAILRSPTRY
ncbi:hypothetical protein C206_01397 [Pseudomonas putida TRO1]|uniref:Uncharacterized protein n=1 Tax=Pseudomonas putida TRO1 TaxID=1227924 RepID=A0AAD2WEV5_PSEPU|nr:MULTISPECIES: hypothetical protein [Pseudomonas]ELS0927495.1 hypothetical protein [Pseudomonas putida]ENY79613.1 hypothetical protein C206_01397 [Pseudomonas putida TRO1]MBH3348888.1 hypothetical protein [Pseudomonas putida]UWH21062.1 hypothetical protein KW568_18760 [Pseudomonas sp. HD6515]HDS0942087.1 hypothetical protein [Pseudomonas putida]